ncbi:MAG: DUF554 domain-containing protein [Clostridia bacterium]|nr:DUF554 domain-containing protein [Clostridia bacterium]
MFGIGTLLNAAAIIVGSGIGLLLRKGLKQPLQDILMSACGLSTMFIGAAGTLAGMLSAGDDGKLSVGGSMLLIASLVLGGLAGQAIDIEKRMDGLGEKLKKLFRAQEDSRFVEGFVSASLVVCVGAMAIVGSMQDGMTGDFSTLAVKSVLDLVIVLVLAASYGPGVMCSAIPILIYQGALTLIAHFVGSFIGDALIADLSFVGSALIFCVGVNLAFGKKFKVGNLLPALLGPIVYSFFR